MTQRWKLTIEYDGGPFAGWQRQPNIISVQECIETAITAFTGQTDVKLTVAGRTDAGVHALGQVAHVDIDGPFDAKAMKEATTFHLRPHPISIIGAEMVADDFSARMSATNRLYCYRILCNRRTEPVLLKNRVWYVGTDLDVAAMQQAANHLLGTHDFSTFRDSECQAKSPVRSIDRIEIIDATSPLCHGRALEIWVEARSFLHHQVRNITGTLKLVGEGKWQPDDVKEALAACDRRRGGPTAPAHGLYFVRVDY